MRAPYLTDAAGFADRFQLPPNQREALIKLDVPSMCCFDKQLFVAKGRGASGVGFPRSAGPGEPSCDTNPKESPRST
jgi:hypothetical protein